MREKKRKESKAEMEKNRAKKGDFMMGIRLPYCNGQR